MITRTELELVD